MERAELFQEFPVPTYEEWREEAEKSLKGASFEAKLLTQTHEGITLQPIYTKKDAEALPHVEGMPGMAPYVRGTRIAGYGTGSWEVNQEIDASTPQAFHDAAIADLERGQTMLNLVLHPASLAGKDPDQAEPSEWEAKGVFLFCRGDFDTAFSGVNLEEVPLFLHTGGLALPMLALLIAHLEKAGANPAKLRGMVGADPLGTLVQTGKLAYPLAKAYDDMAAVTAWADHHAPGLRTIHIQSHPYHNGGSHAVQELAFSLATAVEYIRALLERGLSIEQIAPKIQFSFSIGSNVFMEIAKLRAARLLWSTIIEAFGGSQAAQKMCIHARTSAWNKTVLDPYVNMLRASTEAFSAIVGGIDSLHVSAFDEPIRQADEFSRRIARNTQIILKEEAHLAKVADPAGGSWYVEWLTDAVAQKAWELFRRVEEHDGMKASLEAGIPQAEIGQTAAKKAENIALRKERIVGTNMYPNTSEALPVANKALNGSEEHVQRLQAWRSRYDQADLGSKLAELTQSLGDMMEKAVAAACAGATLGDLTKAWTGGQEETTSVTPIQRQRAAEAFETLRFHAEQVRERTGHQPQVHLATVGPLAKHKARADFCTDFFAVGGFVVTKSEQPLSGVQEIGEAAIASGAKIVVICADDESYPNVAAPLARLLKEKQPGLTVLLAGLPGPEQAAAYREAGVDDFLHVRSNCYSLLYDLQKRIGVIS